MEQCEAVRVRTVLLSRAMTTMGASTRPTPCMEKTIATLRPLPAVALDASLLTVADSGYSPPTPTPSTKRAMAST